MKLKHVAASVALLASAVASTNALAVVNLNLNELPEVTSFAFDNDKLANLTFTLGEASTGIIHGWTLSGAITSFTLTGPDGSVADI